MFAVACCGVLACWGVYVYTYTFRLDSWRLLWGLRRDLLLDTTPRTPSLRRYHHHYHYHYYTSTTASTATTTPTN